MAVVQISRIQIRRGKKNSETGVPQLSSGELGWAVDAQELYIGNGSVIEGAPYVGNTRILTEHDLAMLSEILGNHQDLGDLNELSDQSLKNDIQDLENCLDIVRHLNSVSFIRKDETKRSIGFIAQSVEEVLPQVVATNGNGLKSIAYGNVVAVACGAINELYAIVDNLQTKVNLLLNKTGV